MKKIFLDTDVIIDFFCEREPFSSTASDLFALIQSKKIKAYISVVGFCNLFYHFSKFFSKSAAKNMINELITVVEIMSVDKESAIFALNSEFSDIEDAVQYKTALENKMDLIITRNKKDFTKSKLPVYNPGEFIDKFF